MGKFFLILTCVLSCLLFQSKAQAEEPLTLGVVLGDPTGFSGRYLLDDRNSLDGALAYNVGQNTGLQIQGDYLWDHGYIFGTNIGDINFYYGLGARLLSLDDGGDKGKISFGPRFPIGLLYPLHRPDIDIFAELALIMDVVPSTSADIDGGIGFRIRF